MAIAKKPNRLPPAIASEEAARTFIEGAGPATPPEPPPAKPGRQKKEPVLVRFDDAMLAQIDAAAAKVGLSRAAWLRMIAAKALEEGR